MEDFVAIKNDDKEKCLSYKGGKVGYKLAYIV